jgi:hypothetical protein
VLVEMRQEDWSYPGYRDREGKYLVSASETFRPFTVKLIGADKGSEPISYPFLPQIMFE